MIFFLYPKRMRHCFYIPLKKSHINQNIVLVHTPNLVLKDECSKVIISSFFVSHFQRIPNKVLGKLIYCVGNENDREWKLKHERKDARTKELQYIIMKFASRTLKYLVISVCFSHTYTSLVYEVHASTKKHALISKRLR